DFLIPKLPRCMENVLDTKRLALPAIGTDAAAHRHTQVAWDEGARVGVAMPPRIGPDTPTDRQRVAEPGGAKQTYAGSLAFEDRVGGNGRAVHERRALREQLPKREVGLGGGGSQGKEDSLRGIARQ